MFRVEQDKRVISAHNLIKKMRSRKEYSLQALNLYHGGDSDQSVNMHNLKDLSEHFKIDEDDLDLMSNTCAFEPI